MSISHRTNRLKLINSPKVEQLQNGRYRLTFSLSPKNPEEDWYFANKSRIFADYGSLQSAEMFFDNPADGINPRTGEAYDDMRLVAAQSAPRSIREGGGYIVTFVYETLTGSFVNVVDDKIDFDLNSLTRLTRQSIAKNGTAYSGVIGTTTATYGSETLYLAKAEVENNDSYIKVTEVFIEPGIISITPSNSTPFTQAEAYNITSFYSTPKTIHASTPIKRPGTATSLPSLTQFFIPSEDNSLGFKTYKQYAIATDGGLGSTGYKVSEFHEYFQVTDPGVMGTKSFFTSGEGAGTPTGAASLIPFPQSLPKTRRRKATVKVFLTTSGDPSDEAAYNHNDVEWCSIAFTNFFTDIENNKSSISGSFRTFNNYLKFTESGGDNTGNSATNEAKVEVAGVYTSRAVSTAQGDDTWETTGVFRSKIAPFLRNSTGQQLYLRTDVEF
jgi:hypothetical protein